MNLVVPCPNQANCYIYTIRGPGPSGNGSKVADTVPGVARFFGVSVNSVYAMNPGSASGVQPGDKLKIPPPTR
jgi:LysM repeat protein